MKKSIIWILFALLMLVPQIIYAADPPGTIIGYVDGVKVRSNGSNISATYGKNYETGVYTGEMWQCVEFARRYTYLKKGYLFGAASNARALWDKIALYDGAMGLKHADNTSNNTNRPRRGDLIFSRGGLYGHVGVISDAPSSISNPGDYTIWVASQNWTPTSSVNNYRIKLTLNVTKGSNGTLYYKFKSGFSSTYPIAGWAWRL